MFKYSIGMTVQSGALSDAFCFEHSDLPPPGCHLLDFIDEQWVPMDCEGAVVSQCFEGAECRASH